MFWSVTVAGRYDELAQLGKETEVPTSPEDAVLEDRVGELTARLAGVMRVRIGSFCHRKCE